MGWSEDPGPPSGGEMPRHFLCYKGKTMEKTLSIFIDESGDFGPYEIHAPHYIVTMVFHDQSKDISEDIAHFESYLSIIGYGRHAIHAGPLIRREPPYKEVLMEDRKHLFNALFNFARKLDLKYICAKVKKSECRDIVSMAGRLSKAIIDEIRKNEELLNSYDHVIVYYDNGQIELTKILTAAFEMLYTDVEYRKVKPIDYKLFQITDLICTIELLAEKAENKSFSHSELEFFGNIRNFKKDYMKTIRKKRL